jgi:hypothetical protein
MTEDSCLSSYARQETINELPNKGEIMLTSHQIRCLQTTESWLKEIQSSEEFRQLEYYPDVTLGDAIQAVNELLDDLKLNRDKVLRRCYEISYIDSTQQK